MQSVKQRLSLTNYPRKRHQNIGESIVCYPSDRIRLSQNDRFPTHRQTKQECVVIMIFSSSFPWSGSKSSNLWQNSFTNPLTSSPYIKKIISTEADSPNRRRRSVLTSNSSSCADNLTRTSSDHSIYIYSASNVSRQPKNFTKWWQLHTRHYQEKDWVKNSYQWYWLSVF